MLVDDNGNLTDDATRVLVWDAFNRLVAVARKSDGAAIAAYSYLPDGRRSRKVVFSQTNPGVVEREVRFAWDGAQEVEEQNAAGVTLATFVWSPVYVDELVEFRREAAHPLGAGSFYAHQDVRCDVVAVTNASGVVVEKRRYDDFGREEIRDAGGAVVAASPSGLEYGFQGRRRDQETGWLYFRARFYDPETGRFLSRDPVWDAGNVGGWYTFVGNGPVSGRDPSGRFLFLVVPAYIGYAAIAGALGVAGYEGYQAATSDDPATLQRLQSGTTVAKDVVTGSVVTASAAMVAVPVATATAAATESTILGAGTAGLISTESAATAAAVAPWVGDAAGGLAAMAYADLATGHRSSPLEFAAGAAVGPALRGLSRVPTPSARDSLRYLRGKKPLPKGPIEVFTRGPQGTPCPPPPEYPYGLTPQEVAQYFGTKFGVDVPLEAGSRVLWHRVNFDPSLSPAETASRVAAIKAGGLQASAPAGMGAEQPGGVPGVWFAGETPVPAPGQVWVKFETAATTVNFNNGKVVPAAPGTTIPGKVLDVIGLPGN